MKKVILLLAILATITISCRNAEATSTEVQETTIDSTEVQVEEVEYEFTEEIE
jgi:hypothetical protein